MTTPSDNLLLRLSSADFNRGFSIACAVAVVVTVVAVVAVAAVVAVV